MGEGQAQAFTPPSSSVFAVIQVGKDTSHLPSQSVTKMGLVLHSAVIHVCAVLLVCTSRGQM